MSNIRNTETGEFGLTPTDMSSWFAQQGRAAMIADDFEGKLEQFESYASADQPAHDASTHKVVQVKPTKVGGVLTQKWSVVPLAGDELAQIEAERLAAEQAAVEAARVVVTKRQALLALFDLKGVKDSDIDAQIELIPDETQRYRARVGWQGLASIESDSPTVLMLAAALSLSEQDLAALFSYAKAM